MSTTLTIEKQIHFNHGGRAGRKVLREGRTPPEAPTGHVPRVSRLMALAIRFDGLVRTGAVRDHAELARLGHVTRARVSQVMSLLHLAPDIQEAILFLPRTEQGRDAVILADLLPIALIPDWGKQRRNWAALRLSSPA
jgi:hypothetical protein